MCYSQPRVELILNLAWVAVCILLIGTWICSIRAGSTQFEWTTLIAFALLLVLLFPVISMTDDLVAMSTPAEVEHMLRRSEAPLTPIALSGLLSIFAVVVLVVLNLTAPLFSFFRIRARVFALTFLTGFIGACGVRPPPAEAFAQ